MVSRLVLTRDMMFYMPGIAQSAKDKMKLELFWELSLREIKQRYKQSVLGYAWVILNPFFLMLVLAFVFCTVLSIAIPDIPYPLFLYTGLLPWVFFSSSIQASTGVLVSNASLLKKIYFPRELFVFSSIAAKAVDFFLSTILLVVFFIFYSQPLVETTWLVIPLFLLQVLLTYGISAIAAALNIFYRDIQYIINLGLMIWMYITPVMYPDTLIPERYKWILLFNPMAGIITGYREVLLYGHSPDFSFFASLFLSCALVALLGHLFFKRLEGTFADIV